MKSTIRSLAAAVLIGALAPRAPTLVALRAADFDPVTYDLIPGSSIVDDCLFCGRPAILRSLEGTMVLRRLPVKVMGELYEISGIDFFSPSSGPLPVAEYVVKGGGSLHRTGGDLLDLSLSLDLEVNGVAKVLLESGPVRADALWPSLDIVATEDGERNMLHIYTVRIVAAPRGKTVPYELVEATIPGLDGSYFVDECLPCARPTVPVPMKGTFVLREIDVGGPNPFSTYAVESVDFVAAREGIEYRITGGGQYVWGGEVALVQTMDLLLTVNEEGGVRMTSELGPFPEGVSFPGISIMLGHQNPASDFSVFTMSVVARPAALPPGPEFKRGDSNADGEVDLSDSIFTLNWLFVGGEPASCFEAADTNGDAEIDISDAVGGILFLFLGGPEPPAPGTEACGTAQSYPLGCESYPPCAG